MIPYACKVCGRFDEEGIIGHATSRCKPLGMVAKTAKVVDNKPVVVNKVDNKKVASKSKHGVYKNKEARLEYVRNKMRKYREDKKAARP